MTLVTPDALENPQPVMKGMGKNMNIGIIPVHHFAIHPDFVHFLHPGDLLFCNKMGITEGRIQTQPQLITFSALICYPASCNILFMFSLKGGLIIPFSVMIPAMKAFGTTSNAGFHTATPSGAILWYRYGLFLQAFALRSGCHRRVAWQGQWWHRRGNIKRDFMMLSQDSKAVTADLICRISVCRNTVRADNNQISAFFFI